MIIHLKDHVSVERAEEIAESIGAFFVNSFCKTSIIVPKAIHAIATINNALIFE